LKADNWQNISAGPLSAKTRRLDVSFFTFPIDRVVLVLGLE
jgi:hypothetical protein